MRPAGKRPSNHAGYSFFSVAVNNPVDGLPVWDCDTSLRNHETIPIFWLRLWSASCSMGGVATAPSSPTMPGDLVRSSEHLRGEGAEPIVSTAQPPSESSSVGLNSLVVRLPLELDVAVPVRRFKVRNLIALTKGQVIESQWGHADDVPLAASDVRLAWCEFELVDTRLAVRVTRLG
jgi:flagellar motor switch/type III secretory pathway protein FliN